MTVLNTPDAEQRERGKVALASGLPVQSRAHEASLWVRESSGWRCLQTFPLGAAEPDL